jgi:sulfite reductase alpha subunit-like flavoprotein
MLSKTVFGEEKLGLCSEFLTSDLTKQEFKCQFSSSYRVLKLPEPGCIVMIAHGTGIAPFISMLQKI